jgi:tetratricopeptide (TPR) repeat protein
LILIGFSFPCFAQDSANNPELIQELTIIKKELNERGENSYINQDNSHFTQKIQELSGKLEFADKKIKQLEKELNLKNQQSPQNDHYFISDKHKISKDKQIEELTNKIQTLEEKINQYQIESQNTFLKFNHISSPQVSSNDYLKQLNTSNDTIIEQAKQLSKAYDQIEKLKNSSNSADKIIDNIIIQAEKLYTQGKTREAIAIYEILDRLEIKKPKIYQNMALIYQSSGLNSEANEQYSKLNLLFPDLKGDVKIIRQTK